jgi:Zn-dependent protease with chaperone function
MQDDASNAPRPPGELQPPTGEDPAARPDEPQPPTREDATAGPDESDGRFANRPPGYPSVFVWLRAGIVRDWRGALGAFIATWFYLPIALVGAVVGAIGLAGLGLYTGGEANDLLPAELSDTPVVGSLIDAFLIRSGGVLGGIIGFGIGALAGFLLVVVWPWRFVLEEPISAVTGLAGVVAAAILVGLLYTLYRVLLEPWLLKVSGARQLSRREAAQLTPILHECARRLRLPSVPRLLIEDDLILTNARTYSRHIVVTTSLLTDPPEEAAALLSHELVHWRTGDEVTSAFVRGVALPLFLVHAVPTWLMRTFPHPATNFVVFIFFWPVLLTMKYLVLPFHARDVRTAEYRADVGAVITGNLDGLRSILERRKDFESGRSGWDEAVCASHPAHELRLDQLEQFSDGAATVTAADVTATGDGAGPIGASAVAPPSAEALFGRPGSFGTRQSWLIGGGILVACCLVSSLLGVLQWGFYRPAVAVDGYFSALADHDSADALDWLIPQSRDAAKSDPVLGKLIRSKEYQPPTEVKIESIDRDEDEATAKVSYKLANARQESQLTLQRDKSTSLGLFHGWRIADGLGSLSFASDQSGLTVNGIPIPAATQGYSQLTLPGIYVVAGTRNALSETPRQLAASTVGGSAPTSVQVTPAINPNAQRTADGLVKKYLDECAKQKVASPTGCPFSYYAGSTVQDITWQIVEYPKLLIELVTPTTARVRTSSDGMGTVRATGQIKSSFSGTTAPFDEPDQFSVGGTLTAAGEQLSFQATN